MRILLLNGPPRSGKDTLGRFVADLLTARGYNAQVFKFATTLKNATHRLYGLQDVSTEAFDDCKDEPSPRFLGVTPRQAYIAVSEKLFKPLHGEEVFGKLLAQDVRRWLACSSDDGRQNVAIVTDSGFVPEAETLIGAFVGRPTLVRIHRTGCDFKSDSRNWVALPGVLSSDVKNDGSIEDLRKVAEHVAGMVIR